MTSPLTVQCDTNESEKLSAYLENFSQSHDIAEDIRNDLRLIIEETFTNIVEYAYPDNAKSSVDIQLIRTADSVRIVFTDSGIAFNPLTDSDKYRENDDHCEGGMGIHIIRSLGDEFDYKRIDQKNVFTVTKHYTNQA